MGLLFIIGLFFLVPWLGWKIGTGLFDTAFGSTKEDDDILSEILRKNKHKYTSKPTRQPKTIIQKEVVYINKATGNKMTHVQDVEFEEIKD